jgi:hypothetical protein
LVSGEPDRFNQKNRPKSANDCQNDHENDGSYQTAEKDRAARRRIQDDFASPRFFGGIWVLDHGTPPVGVKFRKVQLFLLRLCQFDEKQNTGAERSITISSRS